MIKFATAQSTSLPVIIIGSGFTGLSAAIQLNKLGRKCMIIEGDAQVGGLAADYEMTNGYKVERFYHHWFTNDAHIMNLIHELGLAENIVLKPTNTGLYYANSIFRLSSPLDLLNFTPLSVMDRLRLGWMALAVRRVKDWRPLESITAKDWLRNMAGENVYRIIWEPLLRGKFGPYSERVGAVWFWNKLKLRGSSRGKGSAEVLAYYKGGFGALAESLGARVKNDGGEVILGSKVDRVLTQNDGSILVETSTGNYYGSAVLITPAPAIAAELLSDNSAFASDVEWTQKIRSIDYLANVCLVLELKCSLSTTYWLNVNDPTFPFVGVIEHTNFESPAAYGGNHIVYLSKYLPVEHEMWSMNKDEILAYALPHIQRMFPSFKNNWILGHHVWKARFAQPIATTHYSKQIPPVKTPLKGVFMANMAQIYPEDRGTNYAIRDGRAAADLINQYLAS
jgi:protoporphyrinogen oxidase